MSQSEEYIRIVEDFAEPLSEARLARLTELEQRLRYRFRHKGLLDVALTHASVSRFSNTPAFDYEGLEFLGDSLVGYFAGEYLLLSDPSRSEGELTRLRSYLVSRKPLARLASDLGLGDYLRVGASERKTGVARKATILADLFESVTAAIYLDGGVETARRFVMRCYRPLIAELGDRQFRYKDFKSSLQEWCHAHRVAVPEYRVLSESGPPHRKTFEIRVFLGDEPAGSGTGRTKREAEQQAAQEALASRKHS